MKNNFDKNHITIKYKDDKQAKQKLITFLVDYYVSKEVLRKVDSNESYSHKKSSEY